jgi:hypothetical protein
MANIEYLAYEAYKKFIDDLVINARTGGGGSRIEHGIILSMAIEDDELPLYHEFIKSLTDSQRKMLITLLRDERSEAFHDLLADLTWRIDCKGFGMTFQGQPMRVGIEGGLHNDFVGRCNGWHWPKN